MATPNEPQPDTAPPEQDAGGAGPLPDTVEGCLRALAERWTLLALAMAERLDALQAQVESLKQDVERLRGESQGDPIPSSWSARLRRILADDGLVTVQQLTELRADDVLEIVNVGPALLAEIRHELGRLGLTLRGDSPVPGPRPPRRPRR